MHLPARGYKIAACCAFGVALLVAQQDWKTADKPPAVDFSGLSDLKARALLRLLRTHDCGCGCGMKVAECRIKDPTCSWSKGLAQAMGDALRAGKNENDAIVAANASKWSHPPDPGKILEDPVKINVDGAPVKGPANAPVTLVEFSDFQCPYCYTAVGKIDALMNAYPGKIKLIFKEFPLETHSHAALAADAAIAANQQGKFWPMYDALFAHHTDLTRPTILSVAQSVGLDMKRFQSDLDSADVKKIVARDTDDGDKAGVEGTPSVFINGRKYNGSLDLAAIKKYIDDELKKTK